MEIHWFLEFLFFWDFVRGSGVVKEMKDEKKQKVAGGPGQLEIHKQKIIFSEFFLTLEE